jgi:6-pyruvoyl-tetrahydropterin synthase
VLSIQKHILLLSNYHFSEFSSYLRNIKAELPFKLINEIKNFGWEQPDSDKLCKRIYKQSDEKTKKKFLQLTHHTLKLSSFLSRNYPSYLKHNLSIIEELINSGNSSRANEIAEYLLDITEKVEDFTTNIATLKFMAMQGVITESKDQLKFHKLIAHNLENEKKLNDVYMYLRENLNYKKKEKNQDSYQLFLPIERYLSFVPP